MRSQLIVMFAGIATIGCGCKGDVPNVAEPAPITSKQEEQPPAPKGLELVPTAYLNFHRDLMNLETPAGLTALMELRKTGDLFTLHLLRKVRPKYDSPELIQKIDELLAEIALTHDEENLEPDEARRLLEVAAYADLTCHSVEHQLRDWTLDHVARFTGTDSIRAELERIQSSNQSASHEEPFKRGVTGRVRDYAQKLLGRSGDVE